ncbi:MAG: DUF6045 family protein [Oscillospiraceae bacterium]|nr:DUF6045 family protein [Oscillospiraceae bacterium]
MDTIWQSFIDYFYGMVVAGLSDFFSGMGDMAETILDLAWIQAIISFFHYVAWALFLAGLAVAVFDAVIESQNGKPALRDLALNSIKGLLAVGMFTVVPVELFRFCVSLSGDLGRAICTVFQIEATAGITTKSRNLLEGLGTFNPYNLFFVIMLGYSVIKCWFANLKRGGILVIQIAVGAMHMISVPRGFTDGFNGWMKQVAALCLTAVLQTTLLTAGLLTLDGHPFLGIGVMISANEVPRIAERFGLDTSVRVNFMSAYYASRMAVNMVKGIARAGAR